MGDQGSIYSILQDVPIMVSPHYRLPKQIFVSSELAPVPNSIDSLAAYPFTVEKETLSMMEEAQKQQEQDRERLSQLQQKYREERIKQQKLAARKIAPGFLDTETRILKPEPLHQLGEESESMRRQQQVDYLRFEQALAPPDPWDQPENDMMALRSILGANNQPITTATTTTTNSITHAQQHTPSQVTSANEQQGYPPVMWTVAPDTTNNGQFQHPPPPTAGPRPHHHTSSPPIAPALPPKPFFDTSACSSGHTSPQTVTSILPNATTAIASSSPSDPSNSPIIPPPLPPPPPAPPASATHPAHDNLIQELVNMGFSRPQAADALEKNDHDLTKATNFLLDHGGD
ncbi:hypothetical protein RO3G_03656 [Lichtheimia corymbifera JMRC:FSU:9682]|uniref:UBA domain-containing protein n=1 Tax=Lichtheimia corymbifera JMRC:FSU:9682 TaxID=1263082 RepID=A0A068SFG1_9FUNG|nr:hypothetical protein RO3G_03656 [Lichtheimia corymbifera JMRC:FSU:9682]